MRVGIIVATVLAIIASTVALSVWRSSREESGAPIPYGALNWEKVSLDTVSFRPSRLPAAILYVLPSCPHCEFSARAFEDETRSRGITALVVAGSDAGDVREYRHRIGLRRAIAVDSGRSFARSARIEWVPSLVLISSSGKARVIPVPAPFLVGHHLRKLN
jgi:hypothetical protein